MSFQEEPESQIEILSYQHTNVRDSPPLFNSDPHEHTHHKPSLAQNRDEPSSENTLLGDKTPLFSSPVSNNDALESQVEDTQFVPIETDTQPSVDYDISPTTRRFLENTESSSAELPPPMILTPLLERQNIPALPDGPGFRFGKPPKPSNMKLIRPPPGPSRTHHEETTNAETIMPPMIHKASSSLNGKVALSTTAKTLTSRGGPSNGTFPVELDLDSTHLETPTEITHWQDQVIAQTDEFPGFGGQQCQSQSISIASNSQCGIRMASPRNISGTFEELRAPLNTTMRTQLSETMKSHSLTEHDSLSPNQPRQAKLGSPPFVEVLLSSDQRPKTIELPTTAITPASIACASKVSNAPGTAEIRNSKQNRSKPPPIAEPFRINDVQEGSVPIDQPPRAGTAVLNLLDDKVSEKLNHPDMLQIGFSGNVLPPSRDTLHDFSRNLRPRSRNKNSNKSTQKHGTNRSPSVGSSNRPLPACHIQQQDLRQNHDLHRSRDSRVQKRGSPRASSTHHLQTNSKVSTGDSETISGEGLLQMATVMFTAEKSQLEKEAIAAQLRIEDLSQENTALQDRIERMSEENQKLLDKNMEFRARSERYKANMNDVMRSQKELNADAKNLDRRKFEFLRKAAIELDTDLLKARAQISKDYRVVLHDARLELDRQNKTIELLKCDINNRLLDLQRERGLRETLQKQLEDRENQQEELKTLLLDHQHNTITVLSSNEDVLKDILNTGVDGTVRLNECRALIKSLIDSEPKPIPALIKLSELVVTLSASVEKKFQAAEDGSIQVRDAAVEVLSELKCRLELISEDQLAQRNLNASITDLREENAILKERIENHEMELSGVEKHLSEVELELQECRNQLAATNDDLRKVSAAPQEDALLRTQLQDLQKSYFIAKEHAESSASEMEKVREDLHKQESLTLLAQQETSNFQKMLRESEARESASDIRKETYVRQMKDESNLLRLNMERDFSSRLAEDEARHNDIVCGLRRQITEAENKLAQTQQQLHDVDKTRSVKEDEIRRIFKQVSVVAMELGSLQGKALSMEQTRDQTGNELRDSQEQLIQYMEKDAEWSARAEDNALEFVKRVKEIDDGYKKSEKVAEVEVDRLEALVLALQKRNEDSDTIISNVARYLRSRGVLRPGISLSDWAVGLPGEQSQQEKTTMNPPHPPLSSELYGVPNLNRGSSSLHSRNSVQISTASISNKEADASTQLLGESVSPVPNPPCASFDKHHRTRLTETDTSLLSSYSKYSSKRAGQDQSTHENHLNMASLELTSMSSAQSNTPEPFSAERAVPHLDLRAKEYSSDSNIHFSKPKSVNGTARTAIPDSQEDLMQGKIPLFTQSLRRVAERPQNVAKGNRKFTRTEVTGYSIRTSETYVDTPTSQRNDIGQVLFANQATDLRSVDSDVESSDLSEPPDNVDKLDLADFMDSLPTHPVLSPKPNSSRTRSGLTVQAPEAKQPRGILKRTNSTAQTNNLAVDANSSGKALESSQLPHLKSIHGRAVSNRRLSRTMSGTSRRDGASHRSPYNRPVAGSKDLHRSNQFQAQDVHRHVQIPATDIFTISSSPAMGQPQRNSKKRALSGVGMNDNKKPTKLPRSVRH